jgi:hypothetical protein
VSYHPDVQILRRSVSIASLLGGEIAATVALHRLGRVEGFSLPANRLGPWLHQARTEELVAGFARIGALVLAWWLLGATVLSLARQIVPGWRHLRALDALTPTVLRRIVERTVAVGLGASLGLSAVQLVGAKTASPRPRVDVPVVRSAPSPARPPDPTTPRNPAAAGARSAVVVVRSGDNLWVIAKRALEREQPAPSPAAVAAYWRRVIAANAGTLRSHDPDLIFPGERIALPAPSEPHPGAG